MKFVLLALLMITGLVGCGTDPVADDLKSYYSELNTLADLETNALIAYDSVTGANTKSDEQTFSVMVNTVVPTYREFVDKLERIKPKTKEVRELHDIYVKAANKQFEAMSQLTSVAAYTNIGGINQALSEARSGVRDFKVKVEEMGKKYSIELPKGM